MLFLQLLPLRRPSLLITNTLPLKMSNLLTTAVSTQHKPRLRGVVFDMDGTLTVPVIDFPAMYKAVLGEEHYLYVKALHPSGIDILHLIQSWTPPLQLQAYQIIAHFERQGNDRLQVMPGLVVLSSAKRCIQASDLYIAVGLYQFVLARRLVYQFWSMCLLEEHEDSSKGKYFQISTAYLWDYYLRHLNSQPISMRLYMSLDAGAAELCAFLDSKKIRWETFLLACENFCSAEILKVTLIFTIHLDPLCVSTHSDHYFVGFNTQPIYFPRRGLITRNVKDSVDIFHRKFGMTFSPALSREFLPCKPDPAPLLHICSAWQVEPNEVIMVGDSLKDDVACGKRAGAYTCLLDETGRYDSPDYASVEHKPDFKVSSLNQVLSLLESHFVLRP
ncbi:hypothetical protein KSS87_008326 [Heliosperma pusillum]|nr:hypothetical protein KSS87_008326 [Heliosperma pusillum]